MITSGQYNIVNCGDNDVLMVNLLRNLYSALLPVIEDAKSPNPSPAFTAFFKDPSYAPFVSDVFTNITTGVPMTPRAPYSFNGAPTFFCVTAPDQFTFTYYGAKDAYTQCMADPTTSFYLGFKPPLQYMVLCPSFFSTNIVSVPPPNNCLAVSAYTSRFRSNGDHVKDFKMWAVMKMIAHYYVYTSTRTEDPNNPTDANSCFLLDAKSSSMTPSNYVYYAASKSSSGRRFARRKDCHGRIFFT